MIINLIGSLIFGGYFINSGVKHFIQVKNLTGYAASKGVPFPRQAVLFSGALIFLGGLGVIVAPFAGLSIRLPLLLIILFLLPVTVVMHNFWKETSPEAKAGSLLSFLTNFALIGAALMLF